MTIQVLQTVFEASGLKSILLSKRIISGFRTRLYRILKSVSSASQHGSTTLRALLLKWRSDPKTQCQIKIYYSEMEVISLKNENDALIERKRKLETELENETAKRRKTEKSLSDQKKLSKKAKMQLKDIVRKLIRKNKARGPSNEKDFTNYSKKQQKRIYKRFVEDGRNALSFFEGYGFLPTKIEAYNSSSGESEEISLRDTTESKEVKVFDKDSPDHIKTILYIKERFGISMQAMHELSMRNKYMPSSYQLLKMVQDMNKKWRITPTPGGNGVQQSIKERVISRVAKLAESVDIKDIPALKIKLTGDGTYIGKRLHVVNIAFTIINEGKKAYSVEGNYPIAILKVKEEYENLRNELRDIREEIENTKFITFRGVQCDIEWYLGGDWKFLAMVCGIGSATSDYPCVWCVCQSSEKSDITKRWSAFDTAKGARTVEKITEMAAAKGALKSKYGCKHPPLFPSIPIKNVIIDTLHLFLRVTDTLQNLLILELRRQDAIEKKIYFNDFDRRKYSHMTAYEKFLNSECGIDFHWTIDKETKKLRWRDLTGPEKKDLFSKINMNILLPSHCKVDSIQKLWKDFVEVYSMICSTMQKEDDIVRLQMKIDSWLQLFLSLYQTKHVTPYMHALVQHVPEFLRKYGNLAIFNQQGLEKLNQMQTKDFFHSTNYRGLDALVMLLQKRNRLHELEDEGYRREKVVHRCRNCSEVGHNLKTCTKPCARCSFHTFCSPTHIKKVDRKWTTICGDL